MAQEMNEFIKQDQDFYTNLTNTPIAKLSPHENTYLNHQDESLPPISPDKIPRQQSMEPQI